MYLLECYAQRFQLRLAQSGMPPAGHFLSSVALYADTAVANSVSGSALSTVAESLVQQSEPAGSAEE